MNISNILDYVAISSNPISLNELTSFVSSPEAGAISSFAGVTRNNFEGKEVLRLEYEAYLPMAEKEMQKICTQIREKWQVLKIAIVHRIGVVPVGDSSIIIVVSSAHRRESLEAVHFAIDEVKAKVPIWKKEYYTDSTEGVWKENKECCFSMQNKIQHQHNHS